MPSSCLPSTDQEQGVIFEENCKLDDSVCTELSLSLEGIHDNCRSLTTLSSLPDNHNKAELQYKTRPRSYSCTLQQREEDVSSVVTLSIKFIKRDFCE